MCVLCMFTHICLYSDYFDMLKPIALYIIYTSSQADWSGTHCLVCLITLNMILRSVLVGLTQIAMSRWATRGPLQVSVAHQWLPLAAHVALSG